MSSKSRESIKSVKAERLSNSSSFTCFPSLSSSDESLGGFDGDVVVHEAEAEFDPAGTIWCGEAVTI